MNSQQQHQQTQFHEQIHDKFQTVFKMDSKINHFRWYEPMLLQGTFILLSILNYHEFTSQAIQNIVYQVIAMRITILCIYYGFQKRQRKVQFKEQNQNHILIFITFSIIMHLLMNIIIIINIYLVNDLQNTSKRILSELNCQNQIEIFIFLMIIFIRFKVPYLRKLMRFTYILHIGIQIYSNSEYIRFIKQLAYCILCQEMISWRINFVESEHNHKFHAFNNELEKMKEKYSKQIKIIQDDIETKSQQKLTTRANELLNKLRLLKYQQLLDKTHSIQKIERRPSITPSHIQTVSLKQLPMDEFIEKIEENNNTQQKNNYTIVNSDPVYEAQFQRRKSNRYMTSITDYQAIQFNDEAERSPSFTDCQLEGDPKPQELKLTNDDINDLLHLLSGRKDVIYLPHFLRSSQVLKMNDDEYSQDAKKFLLSHFTQRESSFKYIDDYVEEGNSVQVEGQTDFNSDFLQYFSLTQKQQQTRVFMENTFNFFKHFQIAKTLKMENYEIIRDFSFKLESLYKYNFYHNSMHAIDVANSTAFFIENGFSNFVDDFDIACLIISSLAHDVGHPGLNNGFMVSNKQKLAVLYNDQSVLENYHSFLFFEILQFEQFNIAANLNALELKGFRKYCINLILDTDLTRHFMLMNKFQNYLDISDDAQSPDKLLLMSICIKCADVGHGSKTLKLHKKWSRRIIEEFFYQGDLEKYLDVPISPMCDRTQPVAKSQEGFLKAIVSPMFTAFNALINNEKIKEICIGQIAQNILYWQRLENDQEFIDETNVDLPKISLEQLMNVLQQPLQINM